MSGLSEIVSRYCPDAERNRKSVEATRLRKPANLKGCGLFNTGTHNGARVRKKKWLLKERGAGYIRALSRKETAAGVRMQMQEIESVG